MFKKKMQLREKENIKYLLKLEAYKILLHKIIIQYK